MQDIINPYAADILITPSHNGTDKNVGLGHNASLLLPFVITHCIHAVP
jgi:hypothetical protein